MEINVKFPHLFNLCNIFGELEINEKFTHFFSLSNVGRLEINGKFPPFLAGNKNSATLGSICNKYLICLQASRQNYSTLIFSSEGNVVLMFLVLLRRFEV